MFCVHCGRVIPEGARFCSYCGKEQPKEIIEQIEIENDSRQQIERHTVQSQPSEKSSTHEVAKHAEELFDDLHGIVQEKLGYSEPTIITHPYQKLGGWLAFFSYASLVLGFLCIIGFILVLIGAGSLNSLLGGNAGGFIILAALVYYGGATFACIRLFQMIQSRDVMFVHFFEKTIIILFAGMIFFMFLVIGYLGSTWGEYSSIFVSSFLGEVLPEFVSGGVGFFLILRYFEKSVRVRTYFGTDEYLRKSIFLKDKPSPEPAVPDRQNSNIQ